MNEEEIKSLGFPEEWLVKELNEGGSKESQLGVADYEITKAIYEGGGLKAVDSYLNATWNAWLCAEEMIRAVDALFNVSKFGTEDEPYDTLVKKVIKEVFENMILALENAETHVHYDNDPFDKAENWIRGFGYGLIDDIHKIISEDDNDE